MRPGGAAPRRGAGEGLANGARRAGPRGARSSSAAGARRRLPHALDRAPVGTESGAAHGNARAPTQAARAEPTRGASARLERTEAEAAARAESFLHAAKLEETRRGGDRDPPGSWRASTAAARARRQPQARRWVLDPRTDELAGGPAGAQKSGSKGAAKRFPLVRGVRLVRGKTTAVFRRQASVDASPNACLSLVGDGPRESLDLELDSKQLRDTLATGIAALLVRLDAPATA